jgi:hypothetical protein
MSRVNIDAIRGMGVHRNTCTYAHIHTYTHTDIHTYTHTHIQLLPMSRVHMDAGRGMGMLSRKPERIMRQ